jgi:hypothetical protein|tara:strand:- start:88 stop:315 length:228 start_codon:yes stop_codon:yes gene_type:complete
MSRHSCAALAGTAVSLSLSHTHAVVVVVIVVIVVHAKLESERPIPAFFREYYSYCESGGGRNFTGDGFASKAYNP